MSSVRSRKLRSVDGEMISKRQFPAIAGARGEKHSVRFWQICPKHGFGGSPTEPGSKRDSASHPAGEDSEGSVGFPGPWPGRLGETRPRRQQGTDVRNETDRASSEEVPARHRVCRHQGRGRPRSSGQAALPTRGPRGLRTCFFPSRLPGLSEPAPRLV